MYKQHLRGELAKEEFIREDCHPELRNWYLKNELTACGHWLPPGFVTVLKRSVECIHCQRTTHYRSSGP